VVVYTISVSNRSCVNSPFPSLITKFEFYATLVMLQSFYLIEIILWDLLLTIMDGRAIAALITGIWTTYMADSAFRCMFKAFP
jgi:hypothetical protein